MKKVLIALFVLAGLAVAWFWFKARGAATAEEAAAPAASVETVALKTQSISQTLDVFGVVVAAPSSEQALTAMFDCVIRKVAAVPGARVAAGDILLEIEPSPDARLLLDSARTALDLATKTLAAAQQRYDLKLANSQELLAARLAEQDAHQKLASYESRGLGGEARIIAPFAGVVSKLDLAAGSLAVAGTPLITLSADQHLEVRLGLEASDLGRVSVGQPVTLVSANRAAGEPVLSTVRVTGGMLDAVTGAAEVRAGVPAGAALLLGEHVKASIELAKKEALVAPRQAVLPDDDKNVLYTVKAGKAVRHEVTVGIGAGELVEISGPDLHEGDAVVTLGNYELTDGMAIQAKEKAAAKEPEGKDAKEAKP